MPPQPPDNNRTDSEFPGEEPSPDDDALNTYLARLWAESRSLTSPLVAYASDLPAGVERREIRRLIRQLQVDEPPTANQGGSDFPYDLLAVLDTRSMDQEGGLRLADYLQMNRRWTDAKHRIVIAVAYPLVLLLIALIIFLSYTFLMAPSYQSMYDDFQTQLPDLTVLIFRISNLLHATWGLVLLLPLVGVITAVLLYRRLVPRTFREYVLDWVPLLGPVMRFSGLTRLTSCLSALIDTGVPAATALRLAGRGARQARIELAADRVASQMELGSGPVRLDQLRPPIPATVVHILQTQSSPTATTDALRRLSEAYDVRARAPLRSIGGVFEPLFIILVGSLIGLLFLGLILPLVSLVQSLSS